MAERGVDEDEVLSALRRSSGPSQPGARPDTMVQVGYGQGRMVKIVTSSSDPQLVISVMVHKPKAGSS